MYPTERAAGQGLVDLVVYILYKLAVAQWIRTAWTNSGETRLRATENGTEFKLKECGKPQPAFSTLCTTPCSSNCETGQMFVSRADMVASAAQCTRTDSLGRYGRL